MVRRKSEAHQWRQPLACHPPKDTTVLSVQGCLGSSAVWWSHSFTVCSPIPTFDVVHMLIFIFGEVLTWGGVFGKGARPTIYLTTLGYPFTLFAFNFYQVTDTGSLLVWV